MKSLKIKAQPGRHRASGFSLLEMMMVVAILIIVASFSIMSLQPSLRAQRVTNAYNIALSALRLAHDNAVAKRASYQVTFTPSSTATNSITVAATTAFTGAEVSDTYKLPSDVAFTTVPGIPTSASATPDGFGSGSAAVDFGNPPDGTSGGPIYFCPDGSVVSAVDAKGNCTGKLSSGVVYIARQGELLSLRAITVWGATGRIHGWRLNSNTSGGYTWQRQ
jgi:prepilin-type N-terminal cleavage/methylation domain-containing protein